MAGILDKAASAGKAIGTGAIRAGVQVGSEVAKPYVQDAMRSALFTSAEILKGQPKPKKLMRRIADMEARRAWIEEDARHLASEITELKRTFDGLGVGSLVMKKRLKSEIRKRLVLQYGLPDYISLLLSGAEGKSMSFDEVNFFKSYSKYLDGKNWVAQTASTLMITSKSVMGLTFSSFTPETPNQLWQCSGRMTRID